MSNNPKNKLNRKAFKEAIAMIESSGGKYLDNPNSSAAGRYHFLYRYIKNIPLLDGISKREFINSPDLQEKVMDMAIDGKLPGFKGYEKHANMLKSKYDTNLRTDELAALTHFLGAKGVEDFMKDPGGYQVPGVNSNVKDYISKYNKFNNTEPGFSTKRKEMYLDVPDMPPAISDDLAGAPGSSFDNYKSLAPEIYSDLLNQVPTSVEQGEIKTLSPQEQSETSFDITGDNMGVDYVEHLSNQFEYGGDMMTKTPDDDGLIEFEGGGTHEENSLGGIPQGVGDNGLINKVEEGETKWAFDDGEYVFSNRISL